MIHILLALSLSPLYTMQALTDSLPYKYRAFRTTLISDSANAHTGYLYALDDSTLSISTAPLPKRGPLSPDVKVLQYNYATLNTVEMRRVNSIGHGALVGALVGAGAGVLGGLASGDDPKTTFIAFTAGQKALGFGLTLGITGAIVGLIVGAIARKRFSIEGKREKFQAMKADLLHR